MKSWATFRSDIFVSDHILFVSYEYDGDVLPVRSLADLIHDIDRVIKRLPVCHGINHDVDICISVQRNLLPPVLQKS